VTAIDAILSGLRDTDATLAELKALAAESPDDPIIGLNIYAVTRRRAFLERRLNETLQRQQTDLLDYRFETHSGPRCSATGAYESIAAFQAILSETFSALPGSPGAEPANLPNEAVTLAFAGASSAPLGVTLAFLNDRLLVMPSAAEAALEYAFAILTAQGASRIQALAGEIGVGPIAAARRWADVSTRHGFGVSLRWQKSGTVDRIVQIPAGRAAVLRDTIDEIRDEAIDMVACEGELLGLDHITGVFRLATDAGTVVAGRLAAGFAHEEPVSLRGYYAATLSRTSTIDYATATRTERWELLALAPANTDDAIRLAHGLSALTERWPL